MKRRWDKLDRRYARDRMEEIAPRKDAQHGRPSPDVQREMAKNERERVAAFQAKYAQYFPAWATQKRGAK